MALWFTLMVNSEPIGTVDIQRIRGGSAPDDVNTYRWKYSRYPEVIGGEVTHRYGDGAVALAARFSARSRTAVPADDRLSQHLPPEHTIRPVCPLRVSRENPRTQRQLPNQKGGEVVAVTKRLRFEVLRRDGFRCYYCGHTAAEAELRVDHVIPEALGGTDEPTNLVTACEPCNSGKSSVQLDGPTVAAVSNDALRWADAIREVAQRRQEERIELWSWFNMIWCREVETLISQPSSRDEAGWEAWERHPKNPPTPATWIDSVSAFITAGLSRPAIERLVAVALHSHVATRDKWRYFCGCCWNEVRAIQAEAAQLLRDDGDADG